MNRIKIILDAITERSGLGRLDGHPLYVYKVTQAEQDELQAALREALSLNPELKQQEQRAAFCLFGAEWFRRHHEHGPWSWDTILEGGLGLSGLARTAFRTRVRKITTEGLRWWKVPPVRTAATTQYLVTLACQGGLPLKTLRNHGAPLRRFLKKVLKHHERYPQERMNDVVDEHSSILPRTLNNEGVRTLAIRIVDCVSELRKLSKPVENTDGGRPEYLDQHHRGWRDRIPMRIDDPEALELVLGLLDQEVTRALPTEGFSVTTTMIRQGDQLTLTRDLAYESVMTEETLWKGLGLESAEILPPKMSLYLKAADTRVRVASVTRRSNSDEYAMVTIPSPPLTGPLAEGTVKLVALAGSHEVASVVVPGGEALPDSAWIFNAEDPAELISVGSAQTRRPAVLVAVPNDAIWESDESSAVELQPETLCGRRMLKVSGQMILHHDETRTRIRTRAETEVTAVYKLSGRIRTIGPNGSEVWLGVPTITEYPTGDHEVVSNVEEVNVRWKRTGRDWQRLSADCVGDVMLRADRDGETIFQTSVTVFPDTFDYRMRPGRNGTGELDLLGIGGAEIFAPDHSDAAIEVSRSGTRHILQVQTSSESRPTSLLVRVAFENSGGSEIRVSCPTDGVGIVDAAGQVISPGQPIPLERLDGLTLQATTADSSTLILVERRENRVLGPLKEVGRSGVRELPLSGIQDYVRGLLAQSDNPDDAVRLVVQRPPSANPQYSFTVSRYPGRLEKEKFDYSSMASRPEFTDVSVTTETLQALRLNVEDMELDVVPLGEPDQPVPEEAVQRAGESTWRIHHELLSPGGYLVTAWANEFTCLRPLRVSVNLNQVEQASVEDVEPADQFDAALNALDGADRRLQWDLFVDNLAVDPGHPGWVKMDALIKATERLPVTTYEAVAAVTRNSEAVALLGLKHFKSAWLWETLEELPFLWAMVPIRSWVAAATRYVAFLNDRLDALDYDADQIANTITMTLDGFSSATPLYNSGMAAVVTCLYTSGLEFSPKYVPIHQLLSNEAEGLLQQRQTEMNRMINEHNRDDRTTVQKWPSPLLPVTDEVRGHLKPLQVNRFKNEWAVLNAPAIAAVYSVHDIPRPENLILQLQQLRGVDRGWFDRAFEVAVFILAGRRLLKDQKCFSCDDLGSFS